jgi:hypothetical protein
MTVDELIQRLQDLRQPDLPVRLSLEGIGQLANAKELIQAAVTECRARNRHRTAG